MRDDPIIEELHKIREARAAEFEFDFQRIAADLVQRQKEDAVLLVRFYPVPEILRRAATRPPLDPDEPKTTRNLKHRMLD